MSWKGNFAYMLYVLLQANMVDRNRKGKSKEEEEEGHVTRGTPHCWWNLNTVVRLGAGPLYFQGL